MKHSFTEVQRQFIKDNVKGITSNELTVLVNEKFKLNLSVKQIRAFKKNNNLVSGVVTTFKAGRTPHNKGISSPGHPPTYFKKGHKPHNYREIGTERINGDDYVDIKISKNKWRGKHLVLWEKYNGPIPPGYAVIFGDGNRRNFDINNLLLVSRKQLITLNQNKLIQKDAELTKTGILIADMIVKVRELEKA